MCSKQICSVAAALLLVTSGVVPAAVGTTAAASSTSTSTSTGCSELDQFVWALSLARINEQQCDPTKLSTELQTVREAEDNQTRLDLFEAAIAQTAQQEVSSTFQQNYLNDSKPRLWMHAESAIARSFENGKSESESQIAAQNAIADNISRMQLNAIESWNVSLMSSKYLDERAKNETGISDDFVRLNRSKSGTVNEITLVGYGSKSVTLANGSTAMTKAIEIRTDVGGFDKQQLTGIADGPHQQSQNGMSVTVHGLKIMPPTDDFEQRTLISFNEHKKRFERMESLNSDLQADVAPFVESTFASYQSGDINSSDVLSRTSLMFDFGTEGGFYDSIAALSSMGLDTPNMSSSGVMRVGYRGSTYDGLVLARSAPNGSWTANTTYNASDISGPVMLATVDGSRLDLDGEFFIGQMTNKSGQKTQSVNTTKYVYQTADTSGLLEKMDRITDLSKEVESRQSNPGGGGSPFDDLGVSPVLVVAVAAVIILARS